MTILLTKYGREWRLEIRTEYDTMSEVNHFVCAQKKVRPVALHRPSILPFRKAEIAV
jgi:hypothetical protein